MKFSDVAVTLCHLEGKKKQVDIAQMSEVLKNLCLLLAVDAAEGRSDVLQVLLADAAKQSKGFKEGKAVKFFVLG
jgi:hypothetical protein